MINHFNAKEYDLFLVSSGSGSQGINLVSANRVVIIDVGWNPSIDRRPLPARSNYGQTRKVFVYRLQTHGTFESKVYKNNLQKLSLANRVVDKRTLPRTLPSRSSTPTLSRRQSSTPSGPRTRISASFSTSRT